MTDIWGYFFWPQILRKCWAAAAAKARAAAGGDAQMPCEREGCGTVDEHEHERWMTLHP
jgi:hypothetical protein